MGIYTRRISPARRTALVSWAPLVDGIDVVGKTVLTLIASCWPTSVRRSIDLQGTQRAKIPRLAVIVSGAPVYGALCVLDRWRSYGSVVRWLLERVERPKDIAIHQLSKLVACSGDHGVGPFNKLKRHLPHLLRLRGPPCSHRHPHWSGARHEPGAPAVQCVPNGRAEGLLHHRLVSRLEGLWEGQYQGDVRASLQRRKPKQPRFVRDVDHRLVPREPVRVSAQPRLEHVRVHAGNDVSLQSVE